MIRANPLYLIERVSSSYCSINVIFCYGRWIDDANWQTKTEVPPLRLTFAPEASVSANADQDDINETQV